MGIRMTLRRGIAIGPVVVSVRRRRADGSRVASEAVARHVDRIAQLFPAVGDVVGPILAAEPSAADAALAFANGYVALHHEPAREVQLRNLLTRLRGAVLAPALRRHLDVCIAESDLRSGVVDRAALLRTLSEGHPAREAFETEARKADELYGAPVVEAHDDWAALDGDVRGRSLVLVFDVVRESLRGQSVLHVAPETELRRWFVDNARDLDLTYRTLDAFSVTEDIQDDLTSLGLADASFDRVICHRVLEHVLDDGSALREIHRILRPGGVLQISVPQSMQLDSSNEWIVQDESHHDHVRQYGPDFEARVTAAGFEVELNQILLGRSRETHLRDGTFPLRVYECRRANDGANQTA